MCAAVKGHCLVYLGYMILAEGRKIQSLRRARPVHCAWKKKRLASMLAKDAQHVGVHSHPGLSQDVLKDVLSLENPSSNMKESIYEIMTLRRRALLITLKKRKRLASMLAKNAQNVGVYSA